MNRLLLSAFFVLSTGCTATELLCFESDTTDPSIKNEWTHHYYLLSVTEPIRTPGGGFHYAQVHGLGYDDAPTPNGGTDVAPISGGAVQDVDGTWIVSLMGTLHQQSLGPVKPYYYITETWVLDDTATMGVVRVANLTKPFLLLLPEAQDDYYEAEVWSVPCETLR